MKGKLIGTLTLLTVIAFFVTGGLTLMSQEFFKAINAQLSLFLFVASVVMTGIYLMSNHSSHTKSGIKKVLSIWGLVVLIFGGLVIFNVLPIRTYYNWLFVGGIIYVLLVELQLLGWGKKQHIIAKLMSYAAILTALFLIAFFTAKWTYSGFQLWITIAAFVNIGACLVGAFFNGKAQNVVPARPSEV
ncbi:MAG: hypothetical protein ACPG21_07515 [Crocinitomicaceae bacterium]